MQEKANNETPDILKGNIEEEEFEEEEDEEFVEGVNERLSNLESQETARAPEINAIVKKVQNKDSWPISKGLLAYLITSPIWAIRKSFDIVAYLYEKTTGVKVGKYTPKKKE